MDISKLTKQLDSISRGFEDINTLITDTETASVDLVQRLSNLSSIGTKGGIVRSIITRASASTGMYGIMQQFSSMLLVFKYITTNRNENIKKEKEMTDIMTQREKVMKRLHRLKLVDSTDNLSALEKEEYYNDASIKHMMKSMTLTQALGKVQDRLGIARKGMLKDNDKIMKNSRNAFIKQNKGRSGINSQLAGNQMIGDFELGGFGGRNMQQKAAVLMNEDQKGVLGSRSSNLKGQMSDIQFEKMQQEALLDKKNIAGKYGNTQNALSESEKRNVRNAIDALEKMESALENSIGNVAEELEMLNDEQQLLIEQLRESGSNVTTIRREGYNDEGKELIIESKAFSDNKPSEGVVQDKIDDMKDKLLNSPLGKAAMLAYTIISTKGIWGTIKAIGKKTKEMGANLVGKLKGVDIKGGIKAIAKFAVAALAVMTGVALIIYLIAKTGFFENVIKWFAKIKDALILFFEVWLQSAMLFFIGIWFVISGVIDLFTAAFKGDFGGMVDALLKIGLGLIGILLGAAGVLLGALLVGPAGIGAIIGLVGAAIISSIIDLGKEAKDRLNESKGKFLKNTAAGAGIGGLIGGAAGGLIGASFGGIGAVPGAIAGAKFGAVIGTGLGAAGKKGFAPFASGGITSGGNYLIGDNGPEIVTLPGNTSVMNNTNTRSALGTTINVHVNGRVGSSEQELNQLADKIGQKISQKMNRYSPTGLRG